MNLILRVGIADEINAHHKTAQERATEAIRHAELAGKLLLEVKAALPHGEFLGWVKQNIQVSPRQAQRYMAAALGKPAPIRELAGKSDTVSHSPKPAEHPAADWWPLPGHWMSTTTDDGAECLVVPSLQHRGYFHISKIFLLHDGPPPEGTRPDEWDGASFMEFTRRPVRADAVGRYLQTIGLADPADAAWQVFKRDGLDRPFGLDALD